MSELIPMDDIRVIIADFLIDTCQCYEEHRTAIDESTGAYTVTMTVTYSGPCMVGQPGQGNDDDDFYLLGLPYDTTTVHRGQVCLITNTAHDTGLVGLTFDIVESLVTTYEAYRQLTMAKRALPGENP